MLETYKATIHGDKIEWAADTPKTISGAKSIEVFVTILDEAKNSELRPYGLSEGDFIVSKEFDESLPEEILASFEK